MSSYSITGCKSIDRLLVHIVSHACYWWHSYQMGRTVRRNNKRWNEEHLHEAIAEMEEENRIRREQRMRWESNMRKRGGESYN
jgi:hypothetical protein